MNTPNTHMTTPNNTRTTATNTSTATPTTHTTTPINNHPDVTGTSGQHAAESTKSAFKEAGAASESIRKNINSYADTLISGKSHTHANTNPNSPLSRETHTTHVEPHSSTGIHPDAKRAGEGLAKGAGALVGKVEDAVHGSKKSSGVETRRV